MTGNNCRGESFRLVYDCYEPEPELDGDCVGRIIVQIDLPLPPSTNHLWKFGKRRCFPSQQYKTWVMEAKRAEIVQECKPPKNRCDSKKVRISIEVFPGKGFRWNRDGSNMIKASEDWLVNNGYIKDDSFQYVRETKVRLADHSVPESFVRLTVIQ